MMNDLDVMAAFRAETPPPAPEALTDARARLSAEMEMAAEPRAGAAKRRWLWPVVPVAGLAAAIAVAVVAGNQSPPELTASTVFHLAAQQVLRTPGADPRPDQFVYVESVSAYRSGRIDEGGTHLGEPEPVDRRIWLSVDGSRDGLLETKPSDGSRAPKRTVLNRCDERGPCDQTAGFKGSLPTTPEAMREVIYDVGDGDNLDHRAFQGLSGLIGETYVPPAQLAAIFEAAATIPGVTVVPDVVDAAGRRGVAVARTYGGIRTELIFDNENHEYLGTREVQVGAGGDLPVGAVLGTTARVRTAIVDQAGQAP
jgi:hypothetical protein